MYLYVKHGTELYVIESSVQYAIGLVITATATATGGAGAVHFTTAIGNY